MNNKVVVYLAERRGCEHTHTLKREPYVPNVVGVGLSIPLQRQNSFLTRPTFCV